MPEFQRKRGSGQELFFCPLAQFTRVGYPFAQVISGSESSFFCWRRFQRDFQKKEPMNGTCRDKIKPGLQVLIVLKKDQRSGKLTPGVVKAILTKSPTHPHGIKVRLESGEVGRVKQIVG
jgi:uncharacterized repeat protein (TIGR03833 family)